MTDKINLTRVYNEIYEETKMLKAEAKPYNREARVHEDIQLVNQSLTETSKQNLAKASAKSLGKLRRIYHWPVVGYVLKTIVNFARLTKRLEQLFADDEMMRMRLNYIEAEMAKLQRTVSFCLQKFPGIDKNFVRSLELLKGHENNFDAKVEDLIKQLNAVRFDISDLMTSSREHATLLNAKKPQNLDLEHFYYEFENRFRGDSDNLEKKFLKYLSYLKNVKTKWQTHPFLDIGCGRGEWLKVLQGQGIKATGVDSNRLMVNEALEAGLDAVHQDAFEYLKNLPDKSLGGLSGFHIVEHLPFETLIHIFDQAFRVLAPGGVLIFETPNPENLMVGSCNFYTDPTHINPIPPHTLTFIAENRGFDGIEVLRSSPIEDENQFTIPEAERLNSWVNKEQDYAVIAFKLRTSPKRDVMPHLSKGPGSAGKANTIPATNH